MSQTISRIVSNGGQGFLPNTIIKNEEMDAELNQLVGAHNSLVENKLERDGTQAMLAPLNMGGYRVYSVAQGSAAGHAVEWQQWQDAITLSNSNLAAETAARIAADLVLTNNLNQEILDRTNAITAEENARVSADITLQTSLTNAIIQEVIDRNAAIAAVVDSAPETLDTLNELAAALGDDPNFATTVSNAIGVNSADILINAADILQNSADILTNEGDITALQNDKVDKAGDTMTGTGMLTLGTGTPSGSQAAKFSQIPTNNNQLTNGAGYQTASQVAAAVSAGSAGLVATFVNATATIDVGLAGMAASSAESPTGNYEMHIRIGSAGVISEITLMRAHGSSVWSGYATCDDTPDGEGGDNGAAIVSWDPTTPMGGWSVTTPDNTFTGNFTKLASDTIRITQTSGYAASKNYMAVSVRRLS